MTIYNSVRIRKLKMSDLKGLEKHNQRTFKETGKSINYARSHLNETLTGNSKRLRDDILTRLDKSKVKINAGEHNASTVAVEIVLSVSPEYFRDNALDWGEFDNEKTNLWKEKVIKTLKDEYGENLINATLHLDEATPHVHAIITPIVEKTRNKRRTKAQIASNQQSETYKTNVLDAKNMFNRLELERLQTITAKPLKSLGIQRGIKGSKKKNQSTKEYWKRLEKHMNIQFKKYIPNITVKEKALFTSNKTHAEEEEMRIKNQVRQFMSSLYKDLSTKIAEIQYWKDKYNTERNRTALVSKYLSSNEEIEEFIKKHKLMSNKNNAEISDLQTQLEKANKKIESLINQDENNTQKLSVALDAVKILKVKLEEAQYENKRLEIDLARSRSNDIELFR